MSQRESIKKTWTGNYFMRTAVHGRTYSHKAPAAKLNKNWFHWVGSNYIKAWPSNSPDLNPIENLWSILNQDRETLPIPNLKAVVRYIWDNLEINILKNLALSANVSLD